MKYQTILALLIITVGCNSQKTEQQKTIDTTSIAFQKMVIDSVHAKALPNVVVDSTHYFDFNGYDSVNGGYRVQYTRLLNAKGSSKYYNYYPKTNTVVDGITFDTIK